MVGGGPEYFIVSITIDGNIYTLMNNKQGNGEIHLVAGGQLGNYCDNICIELIPMLEVIKYFYETGKLLEHINGNENNNYLTRKKSTLFNIAFNSSGRDKPDP